MKFRFDKSQKMRYISSVILAITLGVKAYGPLCSVSKNRVSLLVSASLIPLDENVEKPLDTNNDFAALMSKPCEIFLLLSYRRPVIS